MHVSKTCTQEGCRDCVCKRVFVCECVGMYGDTCGCVVSSSGVRGLLLQDLAIAHLPGSGGCGFLWLPEPHLRVHGPPFPSTNCPVSSSSYKETKRGHTHEYRNIHLYFYICNNCYN